jgi:hypothetical protein
LGDSAHPNDHSIGTDRGEGSIEIESKTLDNFWKESGKPKIDFVKIHVVGEDPGVLKGGREMFDGTKPMIAMVFYPPKWKNESELESEIFQSYDVFQIIESPFLIKHLEHRDLNRTVPTGLFLSPKK